MFSCNCLNVIIESETNAFQPATADSLNLTEEEKADVFFKQEVKQIQKLGRISKKHAGLVVSRNIGNWIMHRCLNCDVHTHAIHRDRGATCVLISSKLLPSSVIEDLKNGDHYSSIFNIIVPTEKIDAEYDQPDNLPPDVQLALGGLKQRVTELLKKETVATEERIRHYTELQYEALDKLKDRAQKEHKALSKVILEKRCQPAAASNYSSAYSTDSRFSTDKVPVSTANAKATCDTPKTSLKPKTISNSFAARQQRNKTHDVEGMFQFDAEEGADPVSSSELDESEPEDQAAMETEKEDSSSVGRNRFVPMNIAKSLPVTIPAFMSTSRIAMEDDSDDIIQHGDDHPSDIAASIKALAKSVHGDTVFGDLPRPRFSTQI